MVRNSEQGEAEKSGNRKEDLWEKQYTPPFPSKLHFYDTLTCKHKDRPQSQQEPNPTLYMCVVRNKVTIIKTSETI